MKSFHVALFVIGTVLAAPLIGCGGDSEEIPVSPHAPTQEQFDQMKEMMSKQSKKKAR